MDRGSGRPRPGNVRALSQRPAYGGCQICFGAEQILRIMLETTSIEKEYNLFLLLNHSGASKFILTKSESPFHKGIRAGVEA